MNERILQKLGISELNAMQEAAADALLHTHKDVVVVSPTGSGKTLAYLLPLVERLNVQSDEVQAVVVVPGRELALQSCLVLKEMGSGLRAMSLYGGRPTMDEHREMRKVRPQIVFGTPGRLNDHIAKGNLLTDEVKWLVIDEFDKCLEMGFHDEMSTLMDSLLYLERRVLLSATESEAIPRFVNMGRTVKVDFSDEEQVPERVSIFQVNSPSKDKLDTLRALLCHLGNESSIVFLNYRDSVERTADYLRQNGFSLSMFHGGLDQKQREDALYKFSNGSANVMVCTDLASRGLDIPDIKNIIHYHLPESEDGYVHRVGRTARWDKEGRAFFILNADEHIPDYVDAEIAPLTLNEDLYDTNLLSIPQPRMATLYIGKGKKDKLSKGDIVGFLCKKGGLKGDEIGKISVEERFTYVAVVRQKLRLVLKNVQGEKIKGVRTVFEEVR
jgi:superfamily II DNA/RNA helicase